jgi:hypothetical protein
MMDALNIIKKLGVKITTIIQGFSANVPLESIHSETKHNLKELFNFEEGYVSQYRGK